MRGELIFTPLGVLDLFNACDLTSLRDIFVDSGNPLEGDDARLSNGLWVDGAGCGCNSPGGGDAGRGGDGLCDSLHLSLGGDDFRCGDSGLGSNAARRDDDDS